MSPGGGITVIMKEANVNVYPYNAGIQLKYYFSLEPLNCPLIPKLTTIDFEASHIYSTNELSAN